MGTGIKLILKILKETNIRELKFINFSDALRINVYRPSCFEPKNDTQNDTQNETQNDIVNLLINIIKSNPNITRIEMAKKIGKSKTTIVRAINKSEKIKYIGSSKTGHWVIKE